MSDDGSHASERLSEVRQTLTAGVEVDLPTEVAAQAQGSASDMAASPDTPGYDAPPPRTPSEGEEVPPAARCVEYPLNDYGNGKRVLEHFGDDLAFVPNAGFFVWDGARFVKDPDQVATRRLAHQMTDLIGQEVWHMPLPDAEAEIIGQEDEANDAVSEIGAIPPSKRSNEQAGRLERARKLLADAKDIKDRRDKSVGRRLTHAKNAGNTNAIKNMLTEAGTIIARPLEDLDADPMLINTLGGVLRFRTEPGEDDGGMYAPPPKVIVDRLDHDRDLLLTKLMPVDLDPQARCPLFDEFIERIQPVPEMRRFIQRWFGYSMTGLTGEQAFAFFYGGGANGKSVLVDLIAKMMGDYAAAGKIESITGKNRRGGGDSTPDLMPMVGARFLRMAEPDAGQRLQEGLVKELTGGDAILVRPPYGVNFLEVYPIFKLTISGNHKPEIHGGDDGIWRRVLLVPFDVQIPKEDRDKRLPDKLWEERAGILNWLIEGLRDYLANGLQVPEQVVAATAEYREDSDPLGTFLTDCCGVSGNPEHTMRSKDLSEAFAYWQDQTGQGAWTSRTIYKRLKAKSGRWKHPNSGQTFTARKSSDPYYDGISLISPFKERWEEHRVDQARAELRWQRDD